MRYIIFLLLAGCATAPPGWTHPTKDRSEWNQDANECQSAAAGISDPSEAEFAKIRCMAMKGWRAN